MNRLVIIGASGHGKVIADIAVRCGYSDIVFLDDDESKKECAGFHVVGKCNEALNMDADKIVAIGNAEIRESFQKQITNVVTLIHPDAVISREVTIGKGTVVMAGVVINSNTSIGDGCIINTCASVDHDCIVRDFVHVSVGSHIAGTCEIGKSTWIGAGTTVSNNINITDNCMIGAGSLVISDIKNKGTYIGSPVHLIKRG